MVLYVARLYMNDSPTHYIGKSLIEKKDEVQVQVQDETYTWNKTLRNHNVVLDIISNKVIVHIPAIVSS